MSLSERYGPWAVIVGGSEGVGAAFAERLAAEGIGVLLVARSADRLSALAERLRTIGGASGVRTIALDLARPGAWTQVATAADGLEVGLLVCNAGAVTRYDDFLDLDSDFHADLIALNVTNPVRMMHHFGSAMRARRRGGIIVVGSTAHLAGMPGHASYSGSKAFLAQFAEALWFELKPYDVHVLALVLGMTRTPAVERNYPALAGLGLQPDAVAARGLEMLPFGPIHYPGGDERARIIAGLDRADAVRFIHEGAAALRNGRG